MVEQVQLEAQILIVILEGWVALYWTEWVSEHKIVLKITCLKTFIIFVSIKDEYENQNRRNNQDHISVSIPLQMTTFEDKPPDYKELFPIEQANEIDVVSTPKTEEAQNQHLSPNLRSSSTAPITNAPANAPQNDSNNLANV